MSRFVSPPGALAVSPAEFDARFLGMFAHNAFRFEQLDWYDSAGTRERVRAFLAGKPGDPAIRAGWDELLRECRQQHKTISRVHAVPDQLTEYLQFEFDFYRGSVAAGEDVRILPRARAAALDLPGFDYWLFDDHVVAVMVYHDDGTWLRSDLVEDQDFVSACRHWKDIAMTHAVPLNDYRTGRAA
jgi:hypothetical protein